MKNELNFKRRRLLIAFNLLMLAALVVFYELFGNVSSTIFLAGTVAVMIILIIYSYYLVFYRTRLWQLVHAADDKLDEREIKVTNTGLKYAYTIFTVTALLVIYWHNITEFRVNGLTAASLLYLAHVLPASVIGWREENIAWGHLAEK